MDPNVLPFMIDRSLITVLQSAVQEACQKVLKVPVRVEQVRSNPKLFNKWAVSATVPLIQRQIDGAISLRFTQATAEGMMSAFYGEPVDFYSERMFESIGEITNIVYGICKATLAKKGYSFELVVPVVTVGPNQNFLRPEQFATLTVHFETDFGPFVAEVTSTQQARLRRTG